MRHVGDKIGALAGGRYRRVEYHKETVRLGSGLTREKLLDHASQQRAIEALRRFGERPVQIGLIGLGSWMFVGNLVMRKMIDMRI